MRRHIPLLVVVLLALTITPGAAQTPHPDEARIVVVEAIPAELADGDYVAVWDDGVIEVWDFDAEEPRRSFMVRLPEGYESYEIRTAAISPAGDRLAIGYGIERWDGLVRVVDLGSGQHSIRNESHVVDIQDLDWSPDGTQLVASAVSGSFDSTECYLYIIDAATGEVTLKHRLPYAAGAWVDWSPLGVRIGITHDSDLILWDVAQQQPAATYWPEVEIAGVNAWSPDGGLVAMLGFDNYNGERFDYLIKVLEPDTGQIVQSVSIDQEDRDAYWRLLWAQDGDLLVLSLGRKLFFWNLLTDDVTEIQAGRGYITDIALTEADTLIYVYGSDEIRTVDLASIGPGS